MSFTGAPESGTVTVIVSRRVKAGREREYEGWLSGITGAAHVFPGYLGANLIRPHGVQREYTSIFRFDSVNSLRAWEQSEVRREWMGKVVDFSDGEATERRVEGLEFWFTLPGTPAAVQPIRHRMMLIVMVAVYLLILGIGPVVGWVVGGAPYPLRLLLTVAVEVPLLTYVIMPWITRTFASWLFPKPAQGR
jgi:uncharacterized protein